jgi:hypothetical protein
MSPVLFLLLVMIAAPGSQAAPLSLPERLTKLLPEGYSEGVTPKGAPCRVIFSWMRGAGLKPEYARAQVIAEPEGNLIDVEIFFDGYRGKAYGRWGAERASVRYREVSLSASRTPKGVLVKAQKRVKFQSKPLEASCLVSR